MAKDYSQRIPSDRDGKTMTQSPPPFTALATLARENASTSSAFGLTQNTTVVQVTTGGGPVGVKWGASVIGVSLAAGTANYDVTVPANSQMLLVVPRRTQGTANWNGNQSPSITGLNVSEGLFSHMALISGTVSSVFVAEY